MREKKLVATGGGRGVGLAMAKRSLEQDVEVVIMGRNLEKLREVE